MTIKEVENYLETQCGIIEDKKLLECYSVILQYIKDTEKKKEKDFMSELLYERDLLIGFN